MADLMADLSLPEDVFTDEVAFIKQVRQGISGQIVKQAIKALNDRELFVILLETKSGNLHRFYKRKALSRVQSEEVLDTLRLYYQASKLFGDPRVARQWLHCEIPALSGSRPVDLVDTSQGRDLVRQVLGKIEFGEFS
ncbi:hypothetical protein CR158_10360 [Halomonas heilongjiangensis]|uniref:Antitoxin Xre/MbcA/ParS-like toxin-binding domain-containing protein n=2 Tax=Halomonas heilongjiangensis TaxID=1387883 RepID=A0A2N7TUC5_9GAMM|nr:hypothetical protein C1H66_01520 [Halomonas heilongjiangensis]PXX90019.1 hypothetical protein CR158_10360 [Halomonas heilongjiangensis]